MNKCVTILIEGAGREVGVTSTVVNLSSMLSKRGKVLLIDIDCDSANGLETRFGVSSSVKSINDIESKLSYGSKVVESYLNTGFENISLINKLSSMKECSMAGVFDAFNNAFDYILIDAGVSGIEGSTSLLNFVNSLFLIVDPSDDSVSRAKKKYQTLYSQGVDCSKIYWIFNKYDKKGFFNPESLRVSLNSTSNFFVLSKDDRVNKSLFKAKPFVFQDCGSVYASELSKLVSGMMLGSDGFLLNAQKDNLDIDSFVDEDVELKREVLNKVISSSEIKKVAASMSHNQTDMLKKKVAEFANQILDEHMLVARNRESLINEIVTALVGLGVLDKFMKDESVTEIMVLSKDTIYTEREGVLHRENEAFSSDAELMGLIDRVVAPINRRVDEASPYVDARLQDGSRVHVVIPPLSIKGPSITIRKFAPKYCDIESLIANDTLNQEMADLLISSVKSKANILVSGGTGSGKTTMLNILSNYISDNERVVTIEDSAELMLKQPHVVSLESRPPNIEGEGEVTIRDLVRTSLRMRPDRIIVGECRGAEALDMLQAMNTGHNGSLTTLHSNTARDSLLRLETLVMYSGFRLPLVAIRRQIASAIDLVVHLSRMKDGRRKVVAISEITGIQGDTISMNDLFVFEGDLFKSNGIRPKYLEFA